MQQEMSRGAAWRASDENLKTGGPRTGHEVGLLVCLSPASNGRISKRRESPPQPGQPSATHKKGGVFPTAYVSFSLSDVTVTLIFAAASFTHARPHAPTPARTQPSVTRAQCPAARSRSRYSRRAESFSPPPSPEKGEGEEIAKTTRREGSRRCYEP